jgi:hypothetical protein
MKKSFLLVCLSLVLLFAACSKKSDPIPEPVGEAKVRYVNAVQGSAAQDFYVNGNKKSTAALAYGFASDYFTITSGSNNFKFTDAGSSTTNWQTAAYNFPISLNATVFYYQKMSGPIADFPIGDDMSSAPVGKAKVRFININKFAGNNAISVSVVGQATVLIPSLLNVDASGSNSGVAYFPVDAGAKFTFSQTGATDIVFDPGIVAGKNYTIWIDGSSVSSIAAHVILQN